MAQLQADADPWRYLFTLEMALDITLNVLGLRHLGNQDSKRS